MNLLQIRVVFPTLFVVCTIFVTWHVLAPTEYACVTEFDVSVGTNGIMACKAEEDVAFRVNSAIEYLRRPSSIDTLCKRFSQENPDCPVDLVRRYMHRIRVVAIPDDPTGWNVEAIADTEEDARTLSEFYVESVVRHFDTERIGLNEKIAAWFDQQSYHRRQRNEDVSWMRMKKAEIIAEAESKSLKIRKGEVVKTRRISKMWR